MGVASAFGASFVVNILGFITYYIYAAAPPWYVSASARPNRREWTFTQASVAAARFDQLLGTHFFDQVYGRGVDVYGAYPSLHVTYPLLTFLIIWHHRELRGLRIPAFAFFALMCLSAVYLQHHYVTDVLMGIGYAPGTWAAVRWFLGAQKRERRKQSASLGVILSLLAALGLSSQESFAETQPTDRWERIDQDDGIQVYRKEQEDSSSSRFAA